MKSRHLHLFPAVLLLLGRTELLSVEPAASSYLVFTCNGNPQEEQFLLEQPVTWIINQTRAIDPRLGQATYRVGIGRASIDRLHIELNQVPYRLDFSADGNRWDTLVSTAGIASKPTQFATHTTDFTDAQREAAGASGHVWIRFRSASESQSEFVQLKHFRLDVRGTEVPAHFVRPAWWRELSPLASGPLMILVGVLPVILFWRRWDATWRIWLGGAALWIISVALKFGVAILANAPMQRWLNAALPQAWENLAFWSYLGLLTGFFECGIFLAVTPLIKRKQWRLGDALALGLGFGACEAVALGVIMALSAAQPDAWACLFTWSESLVRPFERLVTLPIHTAAVVMIVRALVEREWRWFWVSFAYKSAVDAVAAWLLLSGTTLLSHLWLAEWVCFVPFAVLGLLALFFLARTWRKPMAEHTAPQAADAGELLAEQSAPQPIPPS